MKGGEAKEQTPAAASWALHSLLELISYYCSVGNLAGEGEEQTPAAASGAIPHSLCGSMSYRYSFWRLPYPRSSSRGEGSTKKIEEGSTTLLALILALMRVLLGIGEGKEQTTAAGATPPSKLLRQIARAMAAAVAIAYAAFVIYVSATYPRSWIEKLQMLPVCIVAIMAPMLCTIM